MTFQKGQSGNPKGRTSDKEFRHSLMLSLKEADGDRHKLRRITDALVTTAMGGDVRAATLIADRIDGKAEQPVNLGGQPDNPLELTVTAVMERIDGKSRALPNGRSVDGPALEAEQPLHDHRQGGE